MGCFVKYVLFDVDGVFLSEARCFDVSTLTVWEWLYGEEWLGFTEQKVYMNPSDEFITKLRQEYWLKDAIFDWLKAHGINSNWDMVHAYVVAILALWWQSEQPEVKPKAVITQEHIQAWGKQYQDKGIPSGEEIFAWLQSVVPVEATKDEVFQYIAKEVGQIVGEEGSFALLGKSLWTLHVELYQAWYLGDATVGKEGFLHRELPLEAPTEIVSLLRRLKAAGYTIGIGTGRAKREAMIPLSHFGFWQEFDPYHISTADEALLASELCGYMLDKPHPFTYQVALWGNEPSRFVDYVKEPRAFYREEDEVYIVGDSIADFLAARAMGATAVMTLTGLTGKVILPDLERLGVDYIVDSILHISEVFKDI